MINVKQSNSFESEPCIDCKKDTQLGSGNFVNRIPAEDSFICAECQLVRCDVCKAEVLEYNITEFGEIACSLCLGEN